MADERPIRMCDTCGGVDDHPRHVFAHAPGDGQTDSGVAAQALEAAVKAGKSTASIVEHIRDTATVMRHMDCCRDAGCPDGSCDQVTAGATDKRGSALVKHLTSKGA